MERSYVSNANSQKKKIEANRKGFEPETLSLQRSEQTGVLRTAADRKVLRQVKEVCSSTSFCREKIISFHSTRSRDCSSKVATG
jgi:hypothetical protein